MISMIFINFHGFGHGCCQLAMGGPVAPRESFTPFQLVVIIIPAGCYHRFIDLSDLAAGLADSHRFSWFSEDLVSGCSTSWDNPKRRAVAPKESFTRFQLAAIIDFHRFL